MQFYNKQVFWDYERVILIDTPPVHTHTPTLWILLTREIYTYTVFDECIHCLKVALFSLSAPTDIKVKMSCP